jgi:Predicted helicase
MLKNLIKNISSWPELESGIASLPTEHDRGYAFEEFCQAFFILDPIFQFKAVYQQNEVPASILKRLGYPGRKDIGIDGVAVSNDNKIAAYQAKFRRDRNNTPGLRELSTFFTMSDRADWRITITNANKLPSSIHDRTSQSCILSDRFCQLKPDFFKRLRIWLSKKTIAPTKKITPHKTQKEAINAALKHFKDNSRGQMILPCGTGKTLAAMWIAEKLGGRRILVMVPSLALMSQTLREWAENTSLRPFRYLCLCSDTTVDLGNDSPVEHIYEIDIPVTTDSNVVAEYLKKNTKITSVLFSTYQSSKALSEATLKSGICFDTTIFDEAHRTAGAQASIWSLALDDKNVPIKRRLFMTATPRIYAPHITKKAKNEDVLLCSMDDHTIYGEPVYKITFGQAIERDLITDYKVVVICITDAEVRKLVKEGSSVITTDNQEWDAKALAKRLALAKALDAYGLKRYYVPRKSVRRKSLYRH